MSNKNNIRAKIAHGAFQMIGDLKEETKAEIDARHGVLRMIEFFESCLPDDGSQELEELAIKAGIK